MRLYLIRHGETEGNLEKKYVGRTDEPLCPVGIRNLRRLKELGRLPDETEEPKLYVSPMRRCQESAALLFPSAKGTWQEIPDFRECDFGAFENRNYRELMRDEKLSSHYQAWIDSGGTLPFPGGESVEEFKRRCVLAFGNVMAEEAGKIRHPAVLVVHGGTIMSILEAYGEPKKGYYDYQVSCADGYVCDYMPERGVIVNLKRLW